jgi:integrase
MRLDVDWRDGMEHDDEGSSCPHQKNVRNLPALDQISRDTPLRLNIAAALAYPDGSMTPSGLRREAARGRLVIERTAGKDYTTLGAIEHMRELCRLKARERGCGSEEHAVTKKTGETHNAVWIIRDGKPTEGTGCRKDDREGAERALAEYLNRKHLAQASKGSRDPSQIPIADVLALYGRGKTASQSRPKETAGRIERLLGFFGDKMLCDLNGDLCRAYVDHRSTDAAARRELEDLRAAINYHRREGLCSQIVAITLPDERPPRERWLTRKEAAALVRAAWRYREVQKGVKTDRRSRRHVAKFILMGLYTGTRSGAICAAALHPTVGRGWIDIDRGVFYRRPAGRRVTNKRQPPVPVPGQLLAHLRRWKRRGQRFAIEWNGRPVKAIEKAFAHVVADAGLGPDVTPHVLRHTAATWLMQRGTSPWEAAGFLGMTVEMLLERYGHHHPDHLSGARKAFAKHREAVAEAVAGKR